MTWVLGLTAIWLIVSCAVGLVIGRALRSAERTENLGRPASNPSVGHPPSGLRRLVG